MPLDHPAFAGHGFRVYDLQAARPGLWASFAQTMIDGLSQTRCAA